MASHVAHLVVVRRVIGLNLSLIPCHTAAMSGARYKYLELEDCLGPKQEQVISMYSTARTFKTKVLQLTGWLIESRMFIYPC